jgi:hypothetical protein
MSCPPSSYPTPPSSLKFCHICHTVTLSCRNQVCSKSSIVGRLGPPTNPPQDEIEEPSWVISPLGAKLHIEEPTLMPVTNHHELSHLQVNKFYIPFVPAIYRETWRQQYIHLFISLLTISKPLHPHTLKTSNHSTPLHSHFQIRTTYLYLDNTASTLLIH